MNRLVVHVEGQTEVDFVHQVLREHLIASGFHSIEARLLGNARKNRGGIRSWPEARADLVTRLKYDTTCIITTMVDYYGLPQRPPVAWPGRADAARLVTVVDKAEHVQAAMRQDLSAVMGHAFNPSRFVPFVLMHEFEALLFSDCGAICRTLSKPDLLPALESIRREFATPEEINDHPDTAPSNASANSPTTTIRSAFPES